jgi:NAD(P)-dependent dehydrogenase (short-subunit alcohol dehydrogenase family)
MHNSFKDKVVIVTGSSFGIGRATAIHFAMKGANLVLADYIEDVDTMHFVKAHGVDVIFVKCDVSVASDVQHMIQTAVKKFGRIDYAFNNAGIEGVQGNTAACTEENWDKVLAVNLKGVWLCMKYEIEEMLKQGEGAIVNNASVAGLIGFQNVPAYVASKHGIVGLTKTAALEYAKQGLRINAVCPGVIKTAMIDRMTGKEKEVEKQFEAMEPIGRMGEPLEVANAVVWLCSDEASFITGTAMPVDGGFVAA